MTLAIASLSVLVILSNFVLQNVEGQDSSTVFQALEKLTKAVERLEAKIQLQTTSINNIEAKVEIQDAKIGVQATILRDLQAELVKVQNSSLNNLQVTTKAMQVNILSIFEEKFSLLSNLVNNSMAEDQKQVTSLKSLDNKVDAQGALLNNLTANVNMQATSLTNMVAESILQKTNLQVTTAALQAHLLSVFEEKFSLLANLVNKGITEDQKQETSLNSLHFKVTTQADFLTTLNASVSSQATSLSNLQAESNLQNNLLNKLVTTLTTQANEFNNFNTKIDTQTSILTNVQARSNLQGAMLGKMNSNQELQATSLSGLEAASKIHKNLLHGLQNTTVRHSTLLNNLQTKADLQATSINNLVAEVEWHEPVAHFKTNRTIVAFVGDDVEMWCVVRGTPLPEIKWTKENGALVSGRMVTENNRKVLRIKNTQLSDEGTYVCVAANGVGNPVSQAVRLQVYSPAVDCHRIIESDRGNLAIKTLSTGCLWVIKLQNKIGFRLQLDPLMTEPILVIPEQRPSNSNVPSIQFSGSNNGSHQFEGKSLGIVVPPRRERTTLSWTGLDMDGSGVSSSTKLVKDKEGTLEWESREEKVDDVFWVFDHEFGGELNWKLSTDFAARDQENLCQDVSFSVLQIRRNGNISEIQRTCDGPSQGSVTLEATSPVLILLHMKAVEATRSKLRVSWTSYDEPLKKNVDGIFAGTDSGAFVIPFSSMKSKPVSLGLPVNRIYGLTFDWNSDKIYFLKCYVGIIRSNLDASESKILLSDSSSILYGLTIEPTTGNLYYGNRTSRTIRVCSNDVSKCSTIVNSSDSSNVWDLAVHRSKGLLFWSIQGQKVVRANLDGSNATVILNRSVRGIDVDEQEDRLYWAISGGVGSCDMSGQLIRELTNVTGTIFDVAIEKDKVYYGTWDTDAVHVTSKLGMNSRMVAQLTSDVNFIALYGTRASNNPPNPCDEAKCAHLCVLVTRWSYRCTCPDSQILNADGTTCTI